MALKIGRLLFLAITALSAANATAAMGTTAAVDATAGTWEQKLTAGVAARNSGDIHESVSVLEAAVRQAPDAASRVRALTQLGVTLTQAGQLPAAESTLLSAYGQAPQQSRYAIALALGNVAWRARDANQASRYYQEVLGTPDQGARVADAKLSATLNLVALRPRSERLADLEKLVPQVSTLESTGLRARAFFGIGLQASELLASMEVPGAAARPGADSGRVSPEELSLRPRDYGRVLQLAYSTLDDAKQLAERSGAVPLAVEAGDALAQLYESQGRLSDAHEINRQALQAAASLPLGRTEYALVGLEWRAARLQQGLGNGSAALASYLRAAGHLESIRADLPIEDPQGRSTYQTLQRPLFLGLADLALKDFDAVPASEQQARLASVLDVIELSHQAELQDYLGDRCDVDAVQQGANYRIPPGVAVVYPIVLKGRLEVIVRTSAGILHHDESITAAALAREIRTFRSALLDVSSSDYLVTARTLYGQLLAPVEPELTKAGVRELVVVPDGYLRLIPFAALNDGRQFVAERYVVSTVTGLTMMEPSAPRSRRPASLLVGLSTPGPVVDRLVAMGFAGGASAADPAATADTAVTAATAATAALRGKLALPGVQTEIQELSSQSRGRTLMNADFTVARFTREVQSGDYRLVHVASHGFFGNSADTSFLLAYDDVIRLGDLQRLIAAHGAESAGIDLLTLSACDTSTGDERAPLGFAGAAIKAHARSVIGSLWPVSDRATQEFMENFYGNLADHGKAEALTEAQRALMHSGQFSHPYFWAPFVLTGNWN